MGSVGNLAAPSSVAETRRDKHALVLWCPWPRGPVGDGPLCVRGAGRGEGGARSSPVLFQPSPKPVCLPIDRLSSPRPPPQQTSASSLSENCNMRLPQALGYGNVGLKCRRLADPAGTAHGLVFSETDGRSTCVLLKRSLAFKTKCLSSIWNGQSCWGTGWPHCFFPHHSPQALLTQSSFQRLIFCLLPFLVSFTLSSVPSGEARKRSKIGTGRRGTEKMWIGQKEYFRMGCGHASLLKKSSGVSWLLAPSSSKEHIGLELDPDRWRTSVDGRGQGSGEERGDEEGYNKQLEWAHRHETEEDGSCAAQPVQYDPQIDQRGSPAGYQKSPLPPAETLWATLVPPSEAVNPSHRLDTRLWGSSSADWAAQQPSVSL